MSAGLVISYPCRARRRNVSSAHIAVPPAVYVKLRPCLQVRRFPSISSQSRQKPIGSPNLVRCRYRVSCALSLKCILDRIGRRL